MTDHPEAMGEFFDRGSKSYHQHTRENVADFKDFYWAASQPIPAPDHHLLPDPRLALYQKIFQTLKPGGLYIEGDYVVSPETSRKRKPAYDALSKKQGAVGNGLYHLDLFLTLPIQKRMILESDFWVVREHWKQAEAVVLSAEKDRQNRRKQRRLGS